MKCTCLICEVKGEFTESTDVICRPCYDAAMNEKNLAEAALVKFEQLAVEERQGLEAELKKHRWLPVSEGLPEPLVELDFVVEPVGHKRFIDKGYYRKNSGNKHKWFGKEGQYAEFIVTHWKPITLPGKEQEE